MDDSCIILISSCDAYQDILPPFFTLLKKYWPNLQYNIALSTESVNYQDDELNIINIHPDNPNLTWTERIYDALSKIDSDTIFLLCDDFYLYDYVDDSKVRQIVSWLQGDSQIATFTLWPLTESSKPSIYDNFLLRSKYSQYKIAIIAGIWNKKWLQKYLKNTKESAWQFEPRANQRSHRMLFPGKFYSLADSQDIIFPYDFTKIGLFSGKWLPDTKPFLEQNGIELDFKKRGFYNPKFRALTKSVQDSFNMNSRILPNRYFLNDHNNLISNHTTYKDKSGFFTQEYVVDFGVNGFRWIIANQNGFALSNLKITIHYIDKTSSEIDYDLITGAFLKQNSTYIFNSTIPPYMIVPTTENLPFYKIIISGKLTLPATSTQLEASYNHLTESTTASLSELIAENWYELAVSQENLGVILMQPTISFQKDTKKLSSTKEKIITEGSFKYTYNIPQNCDTIYWTPSDRVGFCIKNLVISLSSSETTKTLDNFTIPGFVSVDKGKSFHYLSIRPLEIPVQGFQEITISGIMSKPIPPSIMRKITGHNRKKFLKKI